MTTIIFWFSTSIASWGESLISGKTQRTKN